VCTGYNRIRVVGLILLLGMAISGASVPARADEADRIQPYARNPRYWQYKGRPVLLLGGSGQDNLFNHPTGLEPGDVLEAHLDLLVSVGGNYVRNTMSTREAGNLFAFHRDAQTGLYDLDRFNEAYWQRFRDLLDLTADRGIIVQIEVWDRFDFANYDVYEMGGWSRNPFNPKNNVNYPAEAIRTPPGQREDPVVFQSFFRSLPELNDSPRLLAYQEAFVGKMLSIALAYDHVLYCVSNETTATEEWARHWARFIRRKAKEAGRGVEVTEMWNNHDLGHPVHRRTFDHPDLYSYAEVSQNNHQMEQTHWDNMQIARRLLADRPRPMNNVKVYGGQRHGGGLEEGTHKFWRNILGGCASSRFHRQGPVPGYYGAGLGELAQMHIRSLRMLTDAMNIFVCEPQNDLLGDRSPNEAYCLAEPGRQYAVYFPDGGAVTLDVSAAKGKLEVRWLDISRSAWQERQTVDGGGTLELRTPGKGHWAVLAQAGSQTVVSVDGDRFLINGRPTYTGLDPKALGRLMNVRMVSSTFDDENPATRPEGLDPEANTRQFIATMDEYRAYGILAFTLNLQGGYPGYEGAVNSAFERDGSLKGPYMRRVARVIEAADAKGMVVILGLFYQRQDQVLAHEDAVRAATRNAATWIARNGYTNVLIEIANEYRHGGFVHRILKTEAGQVELMDLVRSVYPRLLVSTSGMGNARFHPMLGKAADFILLHGNETSPEDYAERVAAVAEYGKPVVFNEDWCFSDDRRGIPDAPAKATAAFENGASWGIMNQIRNQHWPFVFGIGRPEEGQNAREDRAAYETIRRLLGISPPDADSGGGNRSLADAAWRTPKTNWSGSTRSPGAGSLATVVH
jgi:hypothetical protein